MKKLFIAFLTLLLLTGCKNNYSTTKTEFTKEELYEKFYNANYKLITKWTVLSANFGFGWFFVPPEKLALLTLC